MLTMTSAKTLIEGPNRYRTVTFDSQGDADAWVADKLPRRAREHGIIDYATHRDGVTVTVSAGWDVQAGDGHWDPLQLDDDGYCKDSAQVAPWVRAYVDARAAAHNERLDAELAEKQRRRDAAHNATICVERHGPMVTVGAEHDGANLDTGRLPSEVRDAFRHWTRTCAMDMGGAQVWRKTAGSHLDGQLSAEHAVRVFERRGYHVRFYDTTPYAAST